jgi:hypothetical protein
MANNNNNSKSDHPTYGGTDSTRGLPVIEFVHPGKQRVRDMVKEEGKGEVLEHQLAEELKKPMEFNWPEGQIPDSEPSKSVKLRLSHTFDPIKATREAFERERAARGKQEKENQK